MSFTKDRETNLDQAVADVVGEPVDPKLIEQAAARVWSRLASSPSAQTPDAAPAPAVEAATGTLRTCGDYGRLLPAYLAGELPPARALLFEDHARTCIPCRRALYAARTGEADRTAPPVRSAGAARSAGRRAGLALAASLAAAVGLSSFLFVREMGFGGAAAQVESVEGHLLQVDGEVVRPLAAGARLNEGEQVRTTKGSRAVLRLADGSRVEINERSALSYDARRSGTTIDLAQGRVIVQAAKQQEGRHLYVATGDCRVAVVGTIFSVNHGTKGSRVSVVEGRVRVARSGREDVLDPGEQVTTRATVGAVPVAQEIAWSKEAPRYEALLAELTALGREIDAQVARPGLRHSTRLLDLAPEGTMIYVGLPNLSASLADTQRLLDERLADNPVLAEWWQETLGTGERADRFRETIERLGSLGRYLGEELAIAVTPDGPVALAEVSQPAAFRAALEEEADRLAREAGKPVLRVVDGPDGATTGDDVLLAWVSDDVLVATPTPALLARMGAVLADPAANPFAATSFHDRVAAAYADGAGWLFSGDLKTLIRHGDRPGEVDRTAESLGILDLDHFIVDRRDQGGRTETRAALTFDQQRRGLAASLAPPAPMGALDFVSSEANLAASFVLRDPASVLDDLFAASPELRAELERARAEHGFDARELAAALGGELVFAIDGPVLPTPSWKLILEVYDPARLDRALADLAARLDAAIRSEGHAGLTLAQEQSGGRTYRTLRSGAFELHYTYEDGYLVAAASRALLDRTLRQREAGNTLVASARFRELLPADQQVNFSALVFHNLGSLAAPLADAAGRLGAAGTSGDAGPGGPPAAALLGASGPTLTYAYGEADRILFASNSQAGPLGMNLGTLVGLGGLIGHADGPETPSEKSAGGRVAR